MKIAHVAQALARNFGGVQTVLHDLARAQHQCGHIVEVLSTNVDAPKGVLEVAENQCVTDDGVTFRHSSVQFRPLLMSVDFATYLSRNIRRYDIIHIHGLYRFPMTYAGFLARRHRVPYVISPHGSLDPFLYSKSSRSVFAKRLYEKCFELPNINGASAIHYTSQEEQNRVAPLRLRAPSFVVPNGVNWKTFEFLPTRGKMRALWGVDDKPLVLFLGRLHLKKGLDILISAFDKVRHHIPLARLVIAGPESDSYGRLVRTWIIEHRLEDAVQLVGPLHGRQVVEAFTDADVFALPSYTENFGMTVVEAMACRLPVVISDQVNIWSEVLNANAGVVTACTSNEVARALVEVLVDSGRASAMGEAGRRLVHDQYTWPRIVASLTAQYRATIDRSNR